jgi:predicted permease
MTASLVAVRGLVRSLSSTFGFDPHHALLVNSDLNMAGYSGDRVPAMQRRMLDAVSALPGVTGAGLIDNIPLGIGWNLTSVFAQNATDFRDSNELAESMEYSTTPGYFRAAGTTLLAGRDFAWSDAKDTPLVVVVNRNFAQKVFGSVQNAVGAHFRQNAKTSFTVIGVVEDGKYMALTEDPRPAFFAPLLQSPATETWLVARTAGDPRQLVSQVHDTLRALDAALPLQILTWDQEQDSALFAARAATVSLGVLGLLGSMLALTGIFGMASYTVGKRLREMGIRMALGAGHGRILSASLGRAFRLLAFGSVAGLLVGMAATRLLGYIVYQASPQDPLVLAGTLLAMLLLGLLATWAPAQRALSVNPSRLMREE